MFHTFHHTTPDFDECFTLFTIQPLILTNVSHFSSFLRGFAKSVPFLARSLFELLPVEPSSNPTRASLSTSMGCCECYCRARRKRRGQRNTQDEKAVDEKAVDEKAVDEKAVVFVSPENTHWHERRRCARLEGASSIRELEACSVCVGRAGIPKLSEHILVSIRGMKWHARRDCFGLKHARSTRDLDACSVCEEMSERGGAMGAITHRCRVAESQ